MKKPSLTHRERILRSIDHLEVDRVPIDYWGVPEVTRKLFELHSAQDMVELSRRMDLDKIQYCGPYPKNGKSYWDAWGIRMKRIPIPGCQGCYEEPEKAVLEDFETIAEIEANYVFPTTDLYDYSVIPEQIDRCEGFAVEGGYISVTYIYQMLRGLENMLVDFALNPELARFLLGEIQRFSHAHMEETLRHGDGRIDIAQVTDDFGGQNGLLMGLAMIDDYLGGIYEDNIRLVRSHGARVFHHDDGAMVPALDWLVGKGIEVLNPLQWHLPGWDLPDLKKRYGKVLCFHGGIDCQSVLPFGSTKQVEEEVRYCIDVLHADRTGFILAPCHNIQANTPMENVLAMYDAARRYGGSVPAQEQSM